MEEMRRKSVIRKMFLTDDFSQTRGFSQGVIVDNLCCGIRTVYLSGQSAPLEEECDCNNPECFEAAVRQVYADIERLLRQAGGSLADIVTTYNIIPNLTAEKRLARRLIRLELLGGNDPNNKKFPTSTTVDAGLDLPNWCVEIEVMAIFEIPDHCSSHSQD